MKKGHFIRVINIYTIIFCLLILNYYNFIGESFIIPQPWQTPNYPASQSNSGFPSINFSTSVSTPPPLSQGGLFYPSILTHPFSENQEQLIPESLSFKIHDYTKLDQIFSQAWNKALSAVGSYAFRPLLIGEDNGESFLKAFKDKSWFKNAGIWNIFDKSLVNFILYQAGLRKGMTPETFDPKGVTTSEVLSVLNDLEVVLNYQENIANNIEESFLRRKIDFDSLADLLMIKAGIDILGKNKSLEEAFGIILNIVKPTGDFSKKMLTIIDKVGKNFNEEEVNKLKKALIITEGVPLVKFLRNTQLDLLYKYALLKEIRGEPWEKDVENIIMASSKDKVINIRKLRINSYNKILDNAFGLSGELREGLIIKPLDEKRLDDFIIEFMNYFAKELIISSIISMGFPQITVGAQLRFFSQQDVKASDLFGANTETIKNKIKNIIKDYFEGYLTTDDFRELSQMINTLMAEQLGEGINVKEEFVNNFIKIIDEWTKRFKEIQLGKMLEVKESSLDLRIEEHQKYWIEHKVIPQFKNDLQIKFVLHNILKKEGKGNSFTIQEIKVGDNVLIDLRKINPKELGLLGWETHNVRWVEGVGIIFERDFRKDEEWAGVVLYLKNDLIKKLLSSQTFQNALRSEERTIVFNITGNTLLKDGESIEFFVEFANNEGVKAKSLKPFEEGLSVGKEHIALSKRLENFSFVFKFPEPAGSIILRKMNIVSKDGREYSFNLSNLTSEQQTEIIKRSIPWGSDKENLKIDFTSEGMRLTWKNIKQIAGYTINFPFEILSDFFDRLDKEDILKLGLDIITNEKIIDLQEGISNLAGRVEFKINDDDTFIIGKESTINVHYTDTVPFYPVKNIKEKVKRFYESVLPGIKLASETALSAQMELIIPFGINEIDSFLTYALMEGLQLDGAVPLRMKENVNRNVQETLEALKYVKEVESFKTIDRFFVPSIVDKDRLIAKVREIIQKQGNPYIQNIVIDTAVKLLLEEYFARELSLRNHRDTVVINYWWGIVNSIDDLIKFRNYLITSKELMPKFGQERIEMIMDIAYATKGFYDLSAWEIVQAKSHPPLDRVFDYLLRFVNSRYLLMDSVHTFSPINLSDAREGAFNRYFSQYLPNSGANPRQSLNFPLQKSKLSMMSDASAGYRQDMAAYPSWALSFPTESIGLPFTIEQTKSRLLLQGVVKEALEAIIGPVQFNYRQFYGDSERKYLNDREVLRKDLEGMVRYFLDTQDLETGIFRDAMGSIDNSNAVTGFGLLALIIGHQLNLISDEEFIERVNKTLDYYTDDPNDPNDFSAENWYRIYSHYFRGGSKESTGDIHSGNSEYSIIDGAGLLHSGIAGIERYMDMLTSEREDYKNDKRWKEIKEKAVQIIDNMDYAAYMVIAGGANESAGIFSSPPNGYPPASITDPNEYTINYAYTNELGISNGVINNFYEYYIILQMATGGRNIAHATPIEVYYNKFRKNYVRSNKSLVGDNYLDTPESMAFQYEYTFQQLDPFMVKDSADRLGYGDSFNFGKEYQKFIFDFYTRTKLLAGIFRHAQNGSFSSLLIPEYYNMDMGISGTNYRWDGTITPQESAGAISMIPGLALPEYKNFLITYWPIVKGSHWFLDSINPERNFVAPVEFGLGIGASLLGMWNALTDGFVVTPAGKDKLYSIWDLVGRSDNAIRGMLRTGFQEDVSPYFIYKDGKNGTPYSFTDIDWLVNYFGWENLPKTTQMPIKDETGRYYKGIEEVININKFEEFYGLIKEKKINLSNINKILADIRDNNTLNALAAAVRMNMDTEKVKIANQDKDFSLFKVSPENVDLFRALHLVRYKQIKDRVFTDLERLKPVVDKGRELNSIELINIAKQYLDWLEKIWVAMSNQNEISRVAFQYYLENSNYYNTIASQLTEAIGKILGIDLNKDYFKLREYVTNFSENLAKITNKQDLTHALSLLFVTLKKQGFEYEVWKDLFNIGLKKLVEQDSSLSSIIEENLIKYLNRDLIFSAFAVNRIKEEEVIDYLRKTPDKYSIVEMKIREYIRDVLRNPEDINLNHISMIKEREILSKRNRPINLYVSEEAGLIGAEISRALHGKNPGEFVKNVERILDELEIKLAWRVPVEKIFGRRLSFLDSEDDRNLLSLIVTLMEQRTSLEDIVNMLETNAKVHLDTTVKHTIISDLTKIFEGSTPDKINVDLNKLEKIWGYDLSRYKNIKQKTIEYLKILDAMDDQRLRKFGDILNAEISSKIFKDNIEKAQESIQEWIQLYTDLKLSNRIDMDLILNDIETLPDLEWKSTSAKFNGNNDWYENRGYSVGKIFEGEIIRFRDNRYFNDTRDPQGRAWARVLKNLRILSEVLVSTVYKDEFAKYIPSQEILNKYKLEPTQIDDYLKKVLFFNDDLLRKIALLNWTRIFNLNGLFTSRGVDHDFSDGYIDISALLRNNLMKIFDNLGEIDKEKFAFVASYLLGYSFVELDNNKVRQVMNNMPALTKIIGIDMAIDLFWDKIYEKLEEQVKSLSPDTNGLFQSFFRKYILNDEKADLKNNSLYQEWAGLRLPEAQETIHRLFNFNLKNDSLDFTLTPEYLKTILHSVYSPTAELNEEILNSFLLPLKDDVGKPNFIQIRDVKDTVEPTPNFLLPHALVEFDKNKEDLTLAIISLYGKENIIEYIWQNDPKFKDRGLDPQNVLWEALKAYYADLVNRKGFATVALRLGISKVLMHNLKELYSLDEGETNLLMNEDINGVLGFYVTETENIADLGVLDRVLRKYINNNLPDFNTAIKSAFTSATPQPLIQLLGDDFLGTALFEYLRNYLEEIKKIRKDLDVDKQINLLGEIFTNFINNAHNIAKKLDFSKKESLDNLSRLLAEEFGWDEKTAISISNAILERYSKMMPYQKALISATISLLIEAMHKMREEINILNNLSPFVQNYLTMKYRVFGLGKERLNLFYVQDIGTLSYYASEVLFKKRKLDEEIEVLKQATVLLEKSLDNPFLINELGIDRDSDEYKFNLELFKFKENIKNPTPSQLATFENTYVDGKIYFWVEKRIIKNKISINDLVRLLEFRERVTPVLESSGLLTINKEDLNYKIGFAEFLIDQAIDLGMKTEEVKNNAQLMNLMQNFYPYFYIKGIKSYWAQEMLKEVNKGKSEEEVLNFFAQFFPVLKKVEEILQDFPEELTLTQAGRESLLNKILKEKREEKGRELTPEEIALFSGEDYLKAQFKNGVVSFWTREMLNKGLTEEQLRETFRGRRSALPLLSTYLGKAADNTDPFVNGLLSLVAEGLREGEFNIVQAIDKEFISALIGEEREKILSLMYEIARLSSFSDFLGIKKIAGTDKEVELQIEELSTNQKGFLMYLTNLAWRLAKKLSKQDALQEIADRLSTLKEFLMLYGWTKPEEIEKLISDSRLMGRLSFFVNAVAPLSRLEIEKQASSRLFTDFLTRYNNGKPIPEDLKSSLGEKVNWTNEMWQVFKGHLEKFLGRKLLSSQAKVKTLPKSTISESTPVGQFVKMVRSQLGDEEVLRINKFVRDVLGESILENEGDFVYQHHLDKELLHRWAVILETFIGKSKDVKELEENWKRLITKFVEISRKFEPYMSEYLREDYDIGNSEHTGLVGWLTERAFNKALKWLYEAKYRDLNPEPNWLNPSWLLNKETELVEKEIKFAIELRPYVEAAHLMRIDPFNPAYSGVWWFYVDGLMAKERPYAVYPAGFFVSEKALKQHLKNQATLFVDLLTKPSASMNGAAAIQFMVYAGRIEQIESYFKKYNGLDTEFIGVLSYFAQEHIFNKIQGSGDCGPVSDFTGAINCNAGLSFDGPLPDAKPLQRGKPSALAILMPYVSELLYGDAERLRMRQTDSDKEGIENENLVKSLLNLIDEWNGRKNGKVNRRQAWDWSAFYGWEKLDKDGKPTGIITNGIPAGNEVTADAPEGRYGYILNQTLLAQIQVTLKIAQQIKEKVAELLGVERLDFNNPEHWKFLIKKAHEVYISARNTALDWENEGRIPTLRYWTPDLALLEDDLSSVTNPIFEKVNYKRTIFNQLPLRSAHLKTGEWLLPQFKDEWRIQALILPYLKEKDKELKLDALLTHSLLKNYFLISKDLGKEIVLDKIKEEEILERGLSIFKEKNSIDILPTISDAELLRLFREEIFALGKEAIIKENFDRAYIEGIKEAYRRLVGKEIDIPRESIETKDNFISRELANYLEKNGYNPTEQDEKDTFNFWSAIYDKLVSLYQERFYFQAEKYAQEAFKQIINSFQFGFYMKWDEVKNTYLVNKRALPFDERREVIEDWIRKLQNNISGINLENFLNYWINYVLEGINFLGYSPLVALRMANDTMKVPASIIIVPGGGTGSGTPSTAPTTPPTTPQTPTTTAQVSITQAPVITAAFDYFGMGWSFTWGEVKGRDNKGKEIPLEYEWEVLDSQGKVLRKGITEGLSVLVDFFAGNLFRVRAIYRENGAILAQSSWAEYRHPQPAPLPQPQQTPEPPGQPEPTPSASPQTQAPVGQPAPQPLTSAPPQTPPVAQPAVPQTPLQNPPPEPASPGRTPAPAPLPQEPSYAPQPRRPSYRQTLPQRSSAPEHQNTRAPGHQSTRTPVNPAPSTMHQAPQNRASAHQHTRAPVNWANYTPPEFNYVAPRRYRISPVSYNIGKRFAYYRNLRINWQNRKFKETVRFWESRVYQPLYRLSRNTQKAFVGTDMLMFGFKSQFEELPYMQYRGANIWHNTVVPRRPGHQSTNGAPLVQNFVADWTERVIVKIEKEYFRNPDKWEEAIKKSLEEANKYFLEKIELYFVW